MNDRADGRLTLEPGCIRWRSWRLDVPRSIASAALAAELVTAGWTDESKFAALRELRHPQGHRLLLVPQTGRVQIRLDLGVPEPEREGTAQQIARDVMAAVQRIDGTGG